MFPSVISAGGGEGGLGGLRLRPLNFFLKVLNVVARS